ncbi:DUF1344 domain-containing protein [Aminobacter sp. MET-1]|uniref:DUF1344 domain-containing protein n=1 Tax=Aminobacter sp. MET-1 TaxID=2951085 RepID=UPI002269C437|nr:DUF1344 domain-containing protein [Aminobacter sp. MET-1]MCX8570726.1 DUF1344 domain-containing protein [Aminobacter sp. MET-1]
MKTSALIATAALFVVAATGVFAKDMTATIKTIDAATSTVVLDNGKSVVLPATIKASTLKEGEKVLITYTDTAGKTTVQSIEPAK